MIAIEIKEVDALITLYKKEIDNFTLELESKLNILLGDTSIVSKDWQRDYINEILKKSKDIICCTPEKLEEFKIEFDKIIKPAEIIKDCNKEFRNTLIESMGYKIRRSDFYPKYFQNLDIKACVYCNSQLAVSVNSYEYNKKGLKDNKVRAKFQVDHSLAKSEYPCFSISLFNLYPVCASCNNSKSTIPVRFKLYSNNISDTTVSKYAFKLKEGCVAKYLQSKKTGQDSNKARDLIEIIFEEPIIDSFVKGSFQDTFDIKGIYETQKDLVEELIFKKEVYNEAYKKSLICSFNTLFTDASLSNRILIGNYTELENTHKRPMAKFTRDIAIQLGLIID